MKLVADKSDVARLMHALSELAQAVERPEALLEDVALRSAYPAVAEIFDNQGYGAWAALTPAYALDKARDGYDSLPILQRTGDLRASLTMPNAPNSISSFGSDGSMAIGSAVPYFGVVNDIRPIAQFQERHFEEMLTVAVDHMAGVAAAEGFEVIEV